MLRISFPASSGETLREAARGTRRWSCRLFPQMSGSFQRPTSELAAISSCAAGSPCRSRSGWIGRRFRSCARDSRPLARPTPYTCCGARRAVDDGAPAGEECVAHPLINRAHLLVGIDAARAAPIVLEVIDAPSCDRCCASCSSWPVAVPSYPAQVSVSGVRRTAPLPNTFRMDVVGQRLHVGELGIRW